MKKALLLINSIFIAGLINAQTLHHIEAGGGPSGPAPYFAPQYLTIELGDTVRWTNSGGTHNVDGTTTAFPNNPEGFTSGAPSNAAWVFDHVFTIPGVYDFECGAFNHADTQFGAITVNDGTSSIREGESIAWNIYPNPAADYVDVTTEDAITSAVLLSIDGKVLAELQVSGGSGNYRITLNEIPTGTYVLQADFDGQLSTRMIQVR